jgi:hypothetical protein
MDRRKQRTLAFQRIVSDWRDTEPKDDKEMTFSHPIMTPLLACSSREESTNTTGQRKNKHPISHA